MKKQIYTLITIIAIFFAITATLVSCDETTTPAETTVPQIEGTAAQTDTMETPNAEITEAPHSHTWSSWTTTIEATCAEEGKRERSCSCGEKESQSIATVAHTEIIVESIAATCKKEGKTEGKLCSVCGLVIVMQEKIPILDHNYVDRVCPICGSEGLYYILSEDGTYYSVSKGHCTDEDIYIPSSYNGLPVTEIKSFFFATQIKNVYIPESVTRICDEAFYNCSSLTSIIIPNSVKSIGSAAFYGCTSLASVMIGNNVTSIESSAFYGCTSITSISIPESITNIASYAFSGCTSLTSINISNSVTSIGYEVFLGCTNLKDIYYTGTEAEWQAIEIVRYNDTLKNATIHYNSKN